MPTFEEDALSRVQQMHRNRQQSGNLYSKPSSEQKAPAIPKPVPKEPEPEPTVQIPAVQTESQKNSGIIDVLFQNKEQNLILLLLILLMEENTEPTLLLALVYLLM